MKKIVLALFLVPVLSFGQTIHLLDSVIEYSRDSTNFLVLDNKTEWTFDANNNLSLGSYYNWDLATSSWVGNNKTEGTFDANSNQTLYSYYNWNLATNYWAGTYKTEGTFDSNNNQTTSNYYTWDLATSSWLLTGSCNSGFSSILLCENAFPVGAYLVDLPYATHAEYIGAAYSINSVNIPSYSTGGSSYSDSTLFYYRNVASTSIENPKNNFSKDRELLRITDLLGRDIKAIKNTPLFYIFNDGTVEKKIIIE